MRLEMIENEKVFIRIIVENGRKKFDRCPKCGASLVDKVQTYACGTCWCSMSERARENLILMRSVRRIGDIICL